MLACSLLHVLQQPCMCRLPGHMERYLLYEQDSASKAVSQPEGDVCGEVVAQAHYDCCNQSILLGTLKARKHRLTEIAFSLSSAEGWKLHADRWSLVSAQKMREWGQYPK